MIACKLHTNPFCHTQKLFEQWHTTDVSNLYLFIYLLVIIFLSAAITCIQQLSAGRTEQSHTGLPW